MCVCEGEEERERVSESVCVEVRENGRNKGKALRCMCWSLLEFDKYSDNILPQLPYPCNCPIIQNSFPEVQFRDLAAETLVALKSTAKRVLFLACAKVIGMIMVAIMIIKNSNDNGNHMIIKRRMISVVITRAIIIVDSVRALIVQKW